jgi:ATP-dependent Zn protease
MGCGCKTNNEYKSSSENYKNLNNKRINGFSNIILKILAFSFMMILLPIIMLAIIWFIFELIILNKEIDMKKITMILTSKIKPFNEGYDEYDDEYDDDDDEDYDEEDYEMIGVDDLTPVTRK